MVRNVIHCVQIARVANMKASKGTLLNVFQSNFHLDSVKKQVLILLYLNTVGTEGFNVAIIYKVYAK